MSLVDLAPRFRWKLCAEDASQRESLAKALDLPPIVAQILLQRKIATPSAAKELLEPTLDSLPDPGKLPDFTAAKEIILATIAAEKPILVHGDYDVDGISGSALLTGLIQRLGGDPRLFLPDRLRDGFSLGPASIEAAEREGAGLVITVDNGTTAYEFLDQFAAKNIPVVVVDHHSLGDRRPTCAALVNPWCDPELFPHFCGTAVAWLLAWGILRDVCKEESMPQPHRRFLHHSLGLAALATVADVMPLRGPNRALVARGAEAAKSGPPGLSELLRIAKVRNPTARDFGFKIGPRINAAGRMGDPALAFRVLAARSGREAAPLAAQLDDLNAQRRGVERGEMEALGPAVEEQRLRGEKAIFTGRHESHFGVLGVVANRFMDATALPTMLWADCGNGIARGSGRAPEGIVLPSLMAAADEWLLGYGGHDRAAGFHFRTKDADMVQDAILNAARKLPKPGPPELQIDLEVAPNELNVATLIALRKLAPFGEQNPEPLFCSAGMTLLRNKPIGDGSHLEMTLERGGSSVRMLAWRAADELHHLQAGDRVDVVFTAELDEFRGRRQPVWTLRDLRPAR